MARNETTYGASGAAQGRIVFQNGKLRIQYGTAPAFTDYWTVDSAGLLTLPTATAAASGLKVGTATAIYDDGGYVNLGALIIANRIATTDGNGSGVNLGVTSEVALQSGNTKRLKIDDSGCYFLQGANGQIINFAWATELTTIAAAATTDTAIQIPINAVVFAVPVRVTVVIPTAATFTVTGTTSGTTFNTAAVDVAADTTNVGTAGCPYKNGAAQTIRITPSAQPGANTGRVRVTVVYYTITPPTS